MTKDDLINIKRWQSQKLHRAVRIKREFPDNDAHIKEYFSRVNTSPSRKLNELVHYFWTAHKHYRSSNFTQVYYPGLSSIYGARNDGLEGMSRLLPLWASYLYSSDASSRERLEIEDYLIGTLTRGTDPSDSAYWGRIHDRSPMICEAADIALSVWLVKDSIWPKLPKKQQENICAWLGQAIGRTTVDNNWHLFIVLIDKVLESICPNHIFKSTERYQRIKSFHVGNGCFKDGENGQIDLYNAWGFHYYFYWLIQVDPEFDSSFLTNSICDFADWYQYLFTSRGLPLFGRSLCYRMATPVPLQAANHIRPTDFSDGRTLNTLYSCWAYFIDNDALKNGKPTQGVFEDNSDWVDPYSGPASSFWCTRSLVIHFCRSQSTDWEKTELLPMASEIESKTIHVDSANLKIETFPESQTVQVTFLNHHNQFNENLIERPCRKDIIREKVFGISQRPNNNLLKKSIRTFDSTLSYYR